MVLFKDKENAMLQTYTCEDLKIMGAMRQVYRMQNSKKPRMVREAHT